MSHSGIGAFAEEFARPSYKWIGPKRLVTNAQNWLVSNYPGGIGFSFFSYSPDKALLVLLKGYREDGSIERFLLHAYNCGKWGGGWEKWQTHRLPLFPYESLHGRVTHYTFSYVIHKDGRSVPSRFEYKFAVLEDFYREWVEKDDFDDPRFLRDNDYRTYEVDGEQAAQALRRINGSGSDLPIRPYFTRGNTGDPDHPVHEIHRQIDRVIERKRRDPHERHFIQTALFDFDNHHIAEHLIHAHEQGVDVECLADWSALSSLNCSENIARMRRAGIPLCGIVRNTPCDGAEGIASMHTKIIIFDGEVAHSSSYNLHFHLWGGNWENALFYYSRDFGILYAAVYHALRGGAIPEIEIDPGSRYNLLYSFGRYHTSLKKYYRPRDAIITEINNARRSLVVCMFDLQHLGGVSLNDHHETDVIAALINARNRGVRVRIILNGMIAHTGKLPEPWDLRFPRPLKEAVQRLKDAWMEVILVYYHESVYSPLHHKFAVFDDQVVITESYNWYEVSVNSDEVLSVIRDERLAGAFLREADLLLGSFRRA